MVKNKGTKMTYKDLLQKIQNMTSEQQNADVTVFLQVSDEYVPGMNVYFAGSENDTFDEDHPYIVVDA